MSKHSSSKASKTDWKRVDSLRDQDIDFSDIPEVTPEMFDKAVIRRGLKDAPPKEQVTVPVDADVIDWFRSRVKGYEKRINEVLRAYMEAKRDE
jgi:uncharacterized protein (DUF4415 family)